jgi:hypothetical protein
MYAFSFHSNVPRGILSHCLCASGCTHTCTYCYAQTSAHKHRTRLFGHLTETNSRPQARLVTDYVRTERLTSGGISDSLVAAGLIDIYMFVYQCVFVHTHTHAHALTHERPASLVAAGPV